MSLADLCVSAAFSRPVRCCNGALTPSTCGLTGRRIEESYVHGDTRAVSVPTGCVDVSITGTCSVRYLSFTPCSDLGGCDSGALVVSPATYAGSTKAACCETATCAGNPEEESGLQQPDFLCRAGTPIPAANTTAGYDTTTCCDATCVGNSDGSPDFSCAPFELVTEANSTQGYDRAVCCDTRCASGTMADFGAGVCVSCPFPSRCADGVTCGLSSEGRGCAACTAGYFTVVSLHGWILASAKH